MEIWEAIQPHIWEIAGSLGMILAILLKAPTKTKEEILRHKKEAAHANTLAKEEALKKALEKERQLDEELKK